MLGVLFTGGPVTGSAMAGRSVVSERVGCAVINGCAAAFGVLHGFEITNLDGFFRCHIVFLSKLFQFFVCGCFCQPQWTAKETALIRTVRLSFTVLLLVLRTVLALLVGRAMMLAARSQAAAAFGIFLGFKITNFYVFLGCHNFSFPVPGFCFVLFKTRGTTNGARHQRHSPWGSDRPDGSAFVSCASCGDFLDHRRAHCSCSTHSLWLPINTIRATTRNATF